MPSVSARGKRCVVGVGGKITSASGEVVGGTRLRGAGTCIVLSSEAGGEFRSLGGARGREGAEDGFSEGRTGAFSLVGGKVLEGTTLFVSVSMADRSGGEGMQGISLRKNLDKREGLGGLSSDFNFASLFSFVGDFLPDEGGLAVVEPFFEPVGSEPLPEFSPALSTLVSGAVRVLGAAVDWSSLADTVGVDSGPLSVLSEASAT
jgi:hypothetical protein